MNRKSTTYITIAILIFIIVFGALKMYFVVNVVLLMFFSVVFASRPDIIISLFIVILPTNGIYTTEANIMGLLGPITITQFFAFLVLYKYKKFALGSDEKAFRIAILFTIFLFVFNIIYELRNAAFDLYDVTWDGAVKRFIKYFFRFGSIYLLIYAISLGKFVKIVISSIHIGIVVLIFSSVFTRQLQELGFLTTDASENVAGFFTIERKSGFFGAGDVNSLGGLLSTYIGFLLIFSYGSVKKATFFFLLGLSFVGVIYTGSRTAIISTILILGLFIIITNPVQRKSLNKVLIILLILLSTSAVYLLFNEQTNTVFTRFQGAILESDINNDGSRVYKWLYYLDDMARNPETLIIGTNHELTIFYSSGFKEQRVPHNLYITVLFHAGIFVLIISLLAWFKLIVLSIKERYYFFLVIPTFAISFYVSDWGYFQYFILFLILVPYKLNITKNHSGENSRKDIFPQLNNDNMKLKLHG